MSAELQVQCYLCPATVGSLTDHQVFRCFEPEPQPEATNDRSSQIGSRVADVLNQHFWFGLYRERDASAFVCAQCWRQVDAFHRFYQSVLTIYQSRWTLPAQLELQHDQADDGVDPLLPTTDSHIQLEMSRLLAELTASSGRSASRTVRKEAQTGENLGKPETDADWSKVDAIMDEDSCSDDDDDDDDDDDEDYETEEEEEEEDGVGDEQDVDHKEIEQVIVSSNIPDDSLLSSTAAANCKEEPHSADEPHDEVDVVPADPSRSPGAIAEDQRHRDENHLIRRTMQMYCDWCSCPFLTFNEACKHLNREHDKVGYLRCCGTKFHKKCKAVEHCKWHLDPDIFTCSICSRNFRTAVAVRLHTIRCHPCDDIPFSHPCDQCEATFKLPVQLQRHMRRWHPGCAVPATRPTVCRVCGDTFASRPEYAQHFAAQHKRIQCTECGKWLKNQATLRRHRATHSTAQQTCGLCGHVSANQMSARRHRRLKHGTPSFECAVCGMMLMKRWALRTHLQRKHGMACDEPDTRPAAEKASGSGTK